MRPDRVGVTDDQRQLLVHWDSAETDTLSAQVLRAHARDAASVRRRVDHGAIEPSETLIITGLEAVGTMGLNITFSDGHDRAIYPWPYLRELAKQKGN